MYRKTITCTKVMSIIALEVPLLIRRVDVLGGKSVFDLPRPVIILGEDMLSEHKIALQVKWID